MYIFIFQVSCDIIWLFSPPCTLLFFCVSNIQKNNKNHSFQYQMLSKHWLRGLGVREFAPNFTPIEGGSMGFHPVSLDPRAMVTPLCLCFPHVESPLRAWVVCYPHPRLPSLGLNYTCGKASSRHERDQQYGIFHTWTSRLKALSIYLSSINFF